MSKPETVNMPKAEGIEKSLLASCLVYPELAEEIRESLDKSAFYRTSHSIFFEAIVYLLDSNAPIDLAAIAQYIRDKQLESKAPIVELAAILDHPVSTNIEYHILKLKEKAALRRGIEICNAGLKRCQNSQDDPAETIEFLKENIDSLEIDSEIERRVIPVSDLTSDTAGRYDMIASGQIEPGVKTGFFILDKILSGIKFKNVYFIGGRPSMGKTALALNISLNAHVPTAIFSLEQSKEELMDRYVSILTRIDLTKITSAKLEGPEWQNISKALGYLFKLPIYIDETPALTAGQIKSRVRRLVRKFGVRLVIIDYIQLMKPDFRKDGNRNLEVGTIAQSLKALAKELNVAVIINSQLSRDLERRPNPNKVPRLSDLRDSGELEQVADGILFVYRPEVYQDLTNLKFEGQCSVIVAKQRQGALGIDHLKFIENCVRFENITLYREEQ